MPCPMRLFVRVEEVGRELDEIYPMKVEKIQQKELFSHS